MLLRPASLGEAQARDALTYEAWGQTLTLAQFKNREDQLRRHAWSKGSMITWLWTDADDRVLCSCETFRIPSRVGADEGISWGIASVFTEEKLRKRGYSNGLLSALTTFFKRIPRAQSAVLYSDVEPRVYERVGYRAIDARDVELPPLAGPAEVEWAVTLSPLTSRAPDRGVLCLETTADQLDWHLERERIYARELGRPVLAHHAATLGDSAVTFAADLKKGELVVLQLKCTSREAESKLLKATQTVAAEYALSCVRVWADSLFDPSAYPAEPRDGSIPMYLPLTEGVTGWTNVNRGLWL